MGERHNVFIAKINKIAFSSNVDKRMESIDLIDTYIIQTGYDMICQAPDIDKNYLNANDPYKAKYQFFINKRESTGLKHLNNSKAFIEYTNDLDDIYKIIEECNSNKERKILIVFDDMIVDKLGNKSLIQ